MRRTLATAVVCALSAGCTLRAAKIPLKASADLQCPEASITVTELSGGDSGSHLVQGCGKRATYELNPLGDWVLNAPVVVDPKYVTPSTEDQQ